MWKTTEGSTGRLLQLCFNYFLFYTIFMVATKYFTGAADKGYLGVSQIEYLVYSTIGGSFICLLIVLVWRWYKLKSNQFITVAGLKFPSEFLYIIPSGICTAVVIPTTTLMFTLPISVMVAVVIMRGSIIVICRIIDAIQIKQGILHKKVFWEEEVAVLFAVIAVFTQLIYGGTAGGFDFVRSPAAMTILTSYLVVYFIRL
ncbi:MAG: hypothetical protein QME64_08600, partial [bacterium]|nr:hypothetical protein [bacterium]